MQISRNIVNGPKSNRPNTFSRPFALQAFLRLYSAIVLLSKTIDFILSAMADQRKLRQNVSLENMNMTSNYDVTNNRHPMQMAPHIRH